MVYAATSSEINGITGRYFGDMKVCVCVQCYHVCGDSVLL